MMNKPERVILTGVILLVSSLAETVNGETLKIGQPYIQVSAGGSIGEDESYGTFRLSGGVDLSQHFGVEAGFTNITDIFFTDVDIVYLSLVATYPINQNTRVAGKVGILSWESQIDELFGPDMEDDGVNAMFGAELQYDLFTQLAIVLSLEYYGSINVGDSAGDETIFPGTIGLRYTF